MTDLSKIPTEELKERLGYFKESIEYLNDFPEYLQEYYKTKVSAVVDITRSIQDYELELFRRSEDNRENDL